MNHTFQAICSQLKYGFCEQIHVFNVFNGWLKEEIKDVNQDRQRPDC